MQITGVLVKLLVFNI